MSKPKRTYSTSCVYCSGPMTLGFRPAKGGISCGMGACLDKHNEAVEAANRERSQRAAETRRTRAAAPRRTTLVGDGSWAFIAAINGLNSDGTRRTR